MKSKSFIVALLTISTLGLMTSCADMFDVDSTRVVYEKDHNLDSTSDSVYTTLGALQAMQQIADRYVILGEVRGDLCEINKNTKTSLRNLAEFNFDADNEYLDVMDYYAVINNCNYALAKLDTTLTLNNKRVMTDEYVALQSIRAWTYLQLAINYGKVPYYTEPITDMAGLEAIAGKRMTVKEITDDLVPQLIPFLDYEFPNFGVNVPQNLYPILRLVVAEFYLWSGDYENAVKYYEEYLMKNKKFRTEAGSGDSRKPYYGFVSLAGTVSTWDGQNTKPRRTPFSEDYLTLGNGVGGYENLAYIRMETDRSKGLTSELSMFSDSKLFYSFDNTHYLYPSTSWKELSGKQVIFNATKDKDKKVTMFKSSSLAGGDMRKEMYYSSSTVDGEDFDAYYKFGSGQYIIYYRRAITYLRYAEAMNALACELDKAWEASAYTDTLAFESSRKYAKNAFYMLKDAYQVFFPEGSELRYEADSLKISTELQEKFIGVHARGTGPVYLDKDAVYNRVAYDGVYVLEPKAISNRLGVADSSIVFSDTLRYIDELIIDELALEGTLEGNRFGDLVRFAERIGDVEVLAKRVAGRKGQDEFDQVLYEKLTDKSNWYLPLK